MRRLLELLLIAATLVITASGCGSGGDQTGGSAKIVSATFPDYLDPALAYTTVAWESELQVYPGLLVFPHTPGVSGAQPQPGLAESLPEISADRKVYKLRLRKNLRFSDGTPLRASDFKASIERVLAMDSPGAGLGYTDIVGAPEFLKTKKGNVTGIEVNDRTGDIQIRLIQPRGVFTYELAIPFSGVVPKGTPRKNQTQSPPLGAGRYVIQKVNNGRSFELVKNKNFSDSLKGTAVDAGKLDTIRVKVVRSVSNEATAISRNSADLMVDDPPPDRIAEIEKRYGSRYRQFPTGSIFYFFLNTQTAPFDKLDVRRAVNYAIDRDAFERTSGGALQPWHNVLPPQVPGYEPNRPPYPHDLDKAKALVKSAGAEGAGVTVWGILEEPAKSEAEYYADVLNKIGLKARTKLIAFSTYLGTLGDRSLKPQTGWYNWAQDYPHPADFIDNLFNPERIVDTGNSNLSYNVGDEQLAKRIDALSREPKLTDEVKKGWAELDRDIQQKAYAAVFGTHRQSTFASDRIDFDNCRGDDWPIGTEDWARLCLK